MKLEFQTKVGEGESAQVIKSEVMRDFGENLDEMVKLFGAEVVYNLAKKKAIIEVQDAGRNALKAGKSAEEATQIALNHVLGQSTTQSKDPVEATLERAKKMSGAELAALIKQIKQIAAAAA